MNKEILSWNNKYKVYTLPDTSVVLSSQDDQFLLPKAHFPLFYLIDGKKTADEIASSAASLADGSTFLYRVSYLKDSSDCFLENDEHHRQSSAIESNYNYDLTGMVVSLAENTGEQVGLFLEEINRMLTPERKTKLIWVDDILDSQLASVIAPIDSPFALISFSGKELKLSPVFSAFSYSLFKQFQDSLLRNKPVIHMLSSLYPEENHSPPIKAVLWNEMETRELLDTVYRHLIESSTEMAIISLTGEVEYHKLSGGFDTGTQAFSEQISNHLNLQSCKVEFNKDGGSRHISPSQTVESLKPFISPVTGIISTIEELESKGDYPVKIYRTAFFKTPPVKDAHKISSDSFVQTCLGKGVTHDQSKASALCEAVERFSAQYQGNEPLYQARGSEINKRYCNFQQLVPYSESQYQKFSDGNHSDSKLKQAAIPYTDESIHWLPTWSLSYDEQVYVPLASCFANTPFEDDRFGRWHSNGCAAGNTLEEAILQGMFELIERDATAIWWYNKIPRPSFDLSRLDPEYYAPLHESLSDKHEYWVLDLTVDTNVPVMVGIGKHKETGGFIFGFGCHLQPELAAQRALTELCQLIPIRDQNGAPFDFDAIEEGEYLFPSSEAKPVDTDMVTSLDIKDDILALTKQLDNLGFEVLALNYSREPLPVKTAKVFVPGLCHIWPQLANERLYQVPVKMGWLNEANDENTVNQQALYI